MTKKIGLYLRSEPNAGGEFQYSLAMLEAVASLPPNRYSVVVGYSSARWQEYLNDCAVKSISAPHGPLGRGLSLGATLAGLTGGMCRAVSARFCPLVRRLRKEQCDLWIFPSQDILGYQLPLPTLVSIHDLMHRYERRFPESTSWVQYRGREIKFKNICRWAKGVLVDSKIGRHQVMESYGMEGEKIHVLPFIPPGYVSSGERPSDFDARYRLPKKFFFYPAQFWEHKNHKNLLKAIAGLKEELPDIKLVLAGTRKNAYASVAKLVNGLKLGGDVRFLGYVPDADLAELYRRARALVMPTYFGPTNIPPLEAFAAGCPVAVSNVYGMPEQVGDAALLFDPDSVSEISACLRTLWIDDRLTGQLVEKGKRRAAAWEKKQFNQRVEDIIERVVQQDEQKTGSGVL